MDYSQNKHNNHCLRMIYENKYEELMQEPICPFLSI